MTLALYGKSRRRQGTLLFLGVFVPMMVYTVWGVVDILTLPMTK